MENGKLIIFEAIDGAGKTTQLELAYQELKAQGYEVVKTREPGGTVVGEKIRDVLLSDIEMNPITRAYLYASSRAEHNIQIDKWIKEGKIVLCDRHMLSSLIYNKDPEKKYSVYLINSYANNILLDHNIDMNYILLDIDKENFFKRIKSREEINHLDLETIEFFEKRRKMYLTTGKYFSAKIIDSNGTIDETHNKIMKEIKSIIEK